MAQNVLSSENANKMRLRRWIWILIGILTIATIGLIALLLGLIVGSKRSGGGSGYPYAVFMANPYLYRIGWRNKLVLASVVLSSFMIGLSPTVFGDTSVDYSVYHKARDLEA